MNKRYRPFQATLTPSGLANFGLTMANALPCEPLKTVVHSYLQIKSEKATLYPIMPDGTQAIYISSQGSMIGGAQTAARDIHLLEPGEYFGIWFYPGSLRAFFNVDLADIADQFADEKYFPCHHFSRLHTDIYRYPTFAERTKVCEQWLLRRYSPRKTANFELALELIYQSLGSEKITQLANKVGWSSRHLNRQFLLNTGLNTKAFSQIVRVQHLSQQLYAKANNPLSPELDLGYFDQAHLIKDFKKHLISTPTAFFKRFMSDSYNP